MGPYLSVVGSLLHIANCVRPDISTAVGILARHALCPGAPHVKAAKRVVQYLWNTKSLGITYSKSAIRIPKIFEGAKHPLDDGTNKLQTFVDADYAMDVSRKSTYGYVLMLNGGPVSWGSTLGKTVATSTCEAEISAAVVACREAVHFKGMLVEFGIMSADSPLQVAEDNSAALAQAQVNGLRHVRNAKHYEVRLAFLQQLVVDGEVLFVYCPTHLQLADMFTKCLDERKFVLMRDALLCENTSTSKPLSASN